MIDPSLVRPHFPALQRTGADGRPPTFFDNPAGTQICQEALARMRDYLVQSNANHGGAFRASRASDAMVRQTREALAAFLGAARPEEISFGQNMTSLTLHLSRSIARELSPGDEVVVTRLDHDANVAPWLALEEERGVTVRWVGINVGNGTLDMAGLERALGPRTRVVAVGLASNAVGTVNPIPRIVEMAHAVGAWTYVDAVHAAPHMPIDVAALDTDFLVCSPYKFFGPHLGLLYGKPERLEQLASYKVRPAPAAPPGKWETGTLPGESIAGLLGTFDYLAWLGREFGGAGDAATRRAQLAAAMQAIRLTERGLSLAALAALGDVPGLKLRGIVDPVRIAERVPTFAFTLAGHSPREVAAELGRRGIAVWDGDYYAYELIRALGLAESGGMVRVGLVHYNETAEIERLAEALRAMARSAAKPPVPATGEGA